MTCGLAVKRPHDYEAYLSPDGVEVKRSRQSHCSPFRPQLGTLAASLPSGQSPKSRNAELMTPFAVVSGKCQLSNNQLEDYLRAEVRYLKRRRLIPRRVDASSDQGSSTSSAYRRGCTSPSLSHSGSDSEGEHSSSVGQKLVNDLYEKPQFSMNQVKLICERLLKEQESRLRFEYETVLNRKLDEKHEQYVQFAKELENRRSESDLSYLS